VRIGLPEPAEDFRNLLRPEPPLRHDSPNLIGLGDLSPACG
jgi:hypothetical protein